MKIIENKYGQINSILITFITLIFIISIISTGAAVQLGIINPQLLSDNDNSIFESIPQESNSVVRVDVNGLLNDNTTKQLINNTSDEFLNNSTNPTKEIIKKPIDTLNNSTNNVTVDEEDVGEVVKFSKLDFTSKILGHSYTGAVIQIDNINHTQMAYLIYGDNKNYTKSEYKNVSKLNYEEKHKSIAKLDEELYIVGDEDAVNKSIDTVRGDIESINSSDIPNIEGDTYINMYIQDMEITNTISGGTIPENASVSYTTDNDNNIFINIKLSYGNNSSEISNVSDEINIGGDVEGVEQTSVDLYSKNMNVTYKTTPSDFENTYNNIVKQYEITGLSGLNNGLKQFESNIENIDS